MRERALAKLLHDETTASDISVWEITDKKGNTFYVERRHIAGYIPIGTKSYQLIDDQMVLEVEVARPFKNQPLRLHKENEGYFAPMDWYKKIQQN